MKWKLLENELVLRTAPILHHKCIREKKMLSKKNLCTHVSTNLKIEHTSLDSWRLLLLPRIFYLIVFSRKGAHTIKMHLVNFFVIEKCLALSSEIYFFLYAQKNLCAQVEYVIVLRVEKWRHAKKIIMITNQNQLYFFAREK